MKKYVYLLIAIMPLTSIAQEKISFFNQNGKIEFQISKEEFFIKFDSKNERQIEENKSINYTKICLKLENINYSFCFYDQDEKLDYKKELTILEILEETNFYNLLL